MSPAPERIGKEERLCRFQGGPLDGIWKIVHDDDDKLEDEGAVYWRVAKAIFRFSHVGPSRALQRAQENRTH